MRKILIAGAFLLASATAMTFSTGASAAQASGQLLFSPAAAQSLVQEAGYRRRPYCRQRYRTCRFRHGVGHDYRRCMRRAGCRI